MMEQLTRENCRLLLAAFIEENDLKVRRVAKAMGCSEATLSRVLVAQTLPSDEFMKQVGIMVQLGFVPYSKLTNAQKEHISESLGAVGGGVLGFGSITAVISTLGITSGLSAAGITSGLAALGTVVGGGMAVGVVVVATIPVMAAAAGYGIIKGVKYFANKWKLDVTEFDEQWEILIVSEESSQE